MIQVNPHASSSELKKVSTDAIAPNKEPYYYLNTDDIEAPYLLQDDNWLQ